MGSISKNFSYKEFEASETADHYHIMNNIHTQEVRDAVKALVEEVLQPLRTRWGEPLHINSGYRCPELNAIVGGVPTSQHVKGEAADVKASNPRELAQLLIAMQLPFDQVILYPTFVHISHRLHGKQRGNVLYNKSYRGPKL